MIIKCILKRVKGYPGGHLSWRVTHPPRRKGEKGHFEGHLGRSQGSISVTRVPKLMTWLVTVNSFLNGLHFILLPKMTTSTARQANPTVKMSIIFHLKYQSISIKYLDFLGDYLLQGDRNCF